MDEYLDTILQNPPHIILAVAIFISALMIFLFYSKKALIESMRESNLLMKYLILEVFRQTKGFFLTILSIYCGLQFLFLPPEIELIVWKIFVVIFAIQLGLWTNEGVSFILKRSKIREEEFGSVTIFHLLGKVIIWSFIAIFLLGNLGFDITALVAGLGVGGVAVALAAQNILGDLFASLSIVIDKPFSIGDFIVIDQYRGRVEQIGLKTTRIRSLAGEQLVFSNGDLLKSRIQNFKRMEKRRISFSLGVTMETPVEKLKTIPAMLQDIVEKAEGTSFDRAHFKSIGDFSHNFEVVYYVLSRETGIYMDNQQHINFQILERFAKEGIEFAYPSQTVYVERTNHE